MKNFNVQNKVYQIKNVCFSSFGRDLLHSRVPSPSQNPPSPDELRGVPRAIEREGRETLLEELLAHFLAPVFAQLPGPAGVADVCALESHLRRNS